jgi:hypothetical protein
MDLMSKDAIRNVDGMMMLILKWRRQNYYGTVVGIGCRSFSLPLPE